MARSLYSFVTIFNLLFAIALKRGRSVSLLLAYIPLLFLNIYAVSRGAIAIADDPNFWLLFISHSAAVIEEGKAFVMFLQHITHHYIAMYVRISYANTLGICSLICETYLICSLLFIGLFQYELGRRIYS